LIIGFAAVLTSESSRNCVVDEWTIVVLENRFGSAAITLDLATDIFGLLTAKFNCLYAPVVLFGLIIVVQVVFGLSAYMHVTASNSGSMLPTEVYSCLQTSASEQLRRGF